MSAAPIIIAGAGIAGLCTAIGLQRAGFPVVVLEQAHELREAGAGVSLAPNATRALRFLGVLDAVRRRGNLPDRAAVKHFETGAELTAYELGAQMEQNWNAPYIQIARSDLQNILLAAARAHDADVVRLGSRVKRVVHTADGVRVEADGTTFDGSCLIAADGVRSAVRGQLFGEAAPHFLGYVAWRSVVPAHSVTGIAMQPDTAVFLGPRRSLLRYKLRGDALVNIVAFAQHETWFEEGWSVPADPAQIRAAFEGWTKEVTVLIEAMCDHGAFKWGLFGRDPLASWRQDRVSLIGDAAHPMLPFLGQGAAMAIEDGVVLARAFEHSPEPREALIHYERARYERAMTTVARADRQGLRIHGHFAAESTDSPVPRDDFAEYGFDAATVAFS